MTVLNRNNRQVICFFVCALLFYPLVWGRLFTGRISYWGELTLFNPALISLLCCVLLLSDYKTLFAFFSYRHAGIIGIFSSFILFAAFINFYKNTYFWSSLYWTAVMIFCAVNRKATEKYLPFFIIVPALATIIHALYEFSFLDIRLRGIPGNRNWNASLIIVFLPFLWLTVFKYFAKYRKILAWPLALISGYSLFVIFRCESKAAIIAALAAGASILVLRWRHKWPRQYLVRAVFLIFTAGIIFSVVFKNQIFDILKEDQRIFLWRGVSELIAQNPWFGCSQELFESSYIPHIPAGYFMGIFTAARHPHSHNIFTQIAAATGIPALLAWCFIIFYAFIKNLREAAGPGKWLLKLYLFAFIFLLVHSMLDIVDLSWPLGCIFFSISGVLLGRAIKNSGYRAIKPPKFIPAICTVTAVCLAAVLANYLYFNFLSTMHYRNARIQLNEKDPDSAFKEAQKSIAAKATPENTYLAARISLYDCKDPKACLKYLEKMKALGIENFDHNNLLKAKALAVLGKLDDSLLYFAREQDNYPLSCVNLYYYRLVLNKSGRKAQADAIYNHMKYLLRLKGFEESDLPALLKNPYIDLRFRQLGKTVKNGTSSK